MHVSKLTNGLGEYWTELGLVIRVLGVVVVGY